MSRFILVLVLFLNACSLFSPFIDRRREAGAKDEASLFVGKSTPEKPAVCYNRWTTNLEKVKRLANEECIKHGTGTYAVPVKQTIFTCRLLVPNHLFFRCEGEVKTANDEEYNYEEF